MAEILTPPEVPRPPAQWPPSTPGEPAWGIVSLYPRQGHWSPVDFFTLPNNRGVELVEGCLEFLPMPSKKHQTVIFRLAMVLAQVLDDERVQIAGYNLETIEDTLRQPDVLATNDASNFEDDRATHADLAIEVVSPGTENRKRDEVKKRDEYAAAGIPEYWIVDPENRSIVVLSLDGDKYVELGCYAVGQTAVSKVIEGFSVVVDECFASMDA